MKHRKWLDLHAQAGHPAAMRKPPPDRLHFCSLTLENVRAFGAEQTLDLSDAKGRPAKWNLIIGQNGVGKTTIMQALARMRPIPSLLQEFVDNTETKARDILEEAPRASAALVKGGDFGDPLWTQAELSQHENDEIFRFLRSPGDVVGQISATFAGPKGVKVEVGMTCEGNGEELTNVEFKQFRHELSSEGPLVIGYGASRHIGHANAAMIEGRDPTDSLFSEKFDLFDAEELLARLHYASLASGTKKDVQRLQVVKDAVADLVPDLVVRDIDIRGPHVPGRSRANTGVQVTTPSAKLPLASLSLGAQTMFAWTVDLAWRMINAYPLSGKPLHQSAIVLMDEIDLHLHPKWQRSLRGHLERHFPNIQFIATTHSPITAQETLAAGGKVAVVRWCGEESVIDNDPIAPREWRFDQVLTSELFGFETSRGPEAERLLKERRSLLRKRRLSDTDKVRLRELDEYEASLPTAATVEDQEFEDWLLKLGRLEGTIAPDDD
ncbi:AAA family ATPase [Methylobacterium iners]|uniref:ATPase AAA-type core domain-containing protein n=1 Tax=Methylobacterium iners TaxID=418707 RepID=A0ABQ4S7A2_9HYPH|nr:AAA family ATPase [Methylobacterium iners]GJD97683.1 hypothetical protein OCOJLMKI_4916 [Methylobacterium iners]